MLSVVSAGERINYSTAQLSETYLQMPGQAMTSRQTQGRTTVSEPDIETMLRLSRSAIPCGEFQVRCFYDEPNS
jgi:hypothetical protein